MLQILQSKARLASPGSPLAPGNVSGCWRSRPTPPFPALTVTSFSSKVRMYLTQCYPQIRRSKAPTAASQSPLAPGNICEHRRSHPAPALPALDNVVKVCICLITGPIPTFSSSSSIAGPQLLSLWAAAFMFVAATFISASDPSYQMVRHRFLLSSCPGC